MRWELTEIRRHPIELASHGFEYSKRHASRWFSSVAQFNLLLERASMTPSARWLSSTSPRLRCSELFALKWCDVLWDELTLLVRRGIVTGVVSDVKTKYSNAGMRSILPGGKVLLNWQRRTAVQKSRGLGVCSPFVARELFLYPGEGARHIIPAGIRLRQGRIGCTRLGTLSRTLLDEPGLQ